MRLVKWLSIQKDVTQFIVVAGTIFLSTVAGYLICLFLIYEMVRLMGIN